MIDANTFIEDIVRVPGAVRYLRDQNIRCLQCGEPIWGTLRDAALEKGYTDADIGRFVEALNRLADTAEA